MVKKGIDCAICKQRIQIDQPMIVFSKARTENNLYAHNCCHQEHLLFEVWNALSLGIKYESQCSHVDQTSNFQPLTFTSHDVAQEVVRQMKEQGISST